MTTAMTKTKTEYEYEEDKPLLVLVLPEKLEKSKPVCETAVSQGAINYLSKWPAHVSAAFIAGWFVFSTFIFFIIITAIFTIPYGREKCRYSRSIIVNEPPNVYFIKHENRTWNSKELCYIETIARNNKNLKVYLINLLIDNKEEELSKLSKLVVQLLELKNEMKTYTVNGIDNFIKPILNIKFKSDEENGRKILSNFNDNIKNIDMKMMNFFNGSRLANVYKKLDEKTLEMAARAFVLWNFSGVALDPATFIDLESLEKYLCKADMKKNCAGDEKVTVNFNGDIQASYIPCQEFIDYFIRQIITNKLTDRELVLKKTVDHFCLRSTECPEVKILNRTTQNELSIKKFDCPTIFNTDENKLEEKKKIRNR